MTVEGRAEQPRPPETPKSEFVAKLERLWKKGNFVCVGLDSDYSQLPQDALDNLTKMARQEGFVKDTIAWRMTTFNIAIIESTHDLVCAYKPNIAFYEAQGHEGLLALAKTIEYIKENYPEIPVILDAKRGDIENTNLGYVEAAFDGFGADAITVHPYLGKEALQPFLDRKDKGIFVLARTSNRGAGEFQDLSVRIVPYSEGEPIKLYEYIALRVASNWNENGNCGVVVGATYPKELAQVREIVGDMPILIPGVGAQGADIEATVQAGKDSRNLGMIINSSRGIIFKSSGPDFAEAARREVQKLREEINQYC